MALHVVGHVYVHGMQLSSSVYAGWFVDLLQRACATQSACLPSSTTCLYAEMC